ncbi:hypothetical protein CFC35_22990 [Streptomyces sp. FBKL.4005]|uniref:hypothetical protein n=1 Tax=Streptomyces sp. FBKL.4005 TaxID=2015515 RepID=UPI000B963705|nr:hypothetical protein [Streptomyces sp. FBKL.4005]OYP17017.1 hypothetical protein CFC35_22990 [Streptomyces sp. FBKL.4005]
MSRTHTIAAVLSHAQPVRQPLAYELRGSVVQLLGPGTTVPTWSASPQVLAEAIDSALQKDTRRRIQQQTGESTARAEILAVLQAAGYPAGPAAELIARAFREPHASGQSPAVPETLAGGHALIVQRTEFELLGTCQCGRALGRTTSHGTADSLAVPWERHTCTEVMAGV